MKAIIPKNDKARKAGSIKGMKAKARARAGYKIAIGAIGEENSRDRSLACRMSQVGAIAGAKLRQIAMAHLNTSTPDGKFHFATVDESETR